MGDPVTAPVVAYQGVPGAFSELAIRGIWGDAATPLSCQAFHDVARAVLERRAHVGVIPVENSIAGRVASGVDAITRTGLRVIGEHELRIELCLLGIPGTTLQSLRTAESHPVALRQCAAFLAAHPALEAREAFDTAGAARDVAAAGDPTRAAVASASAGSAYGLEIVRQGIQDVDDNTTRFALVALQGARAQSSALDHVRPGVKLGG